MTSEQWDVLRRIAERGLRMAQAGAADFLSSTQTQAIADHARKIVHEGYLDLWQHMLDELQRVKP